MDLRRQEEVLNSQRDNIYIQKTLEDVQGFFVFVLEKMVKLTVYQTLA